MLVGTRFQLGILINPIKVNVNFFPRWRLLLIFKPVFVKDAQTECLTKEEEENPWLRRSLSPFVCFFIVQSKWKVPWIGLGMWCWGWEYLTLLFIPFPPNLNPHSSCCFPHRGKCIIQLPVFFQIAGRLFKSDNGTRGRVKYPSLYPVQTLPSTVAVAALNTKQNTALLWEQVMSFLVSLCHLAWPFPPQLIVPRIAT